MINCMAKDKLATYAKIVQAERRNSNLIEVSSEAPPILSKDSANRGQKIELVQNFLPRYRLSYPKIVQTGGKTQIY